MAQPRPILKRLQKSPRASGTPGTAVRVSKRPKAVRFSMPRQQRAKRGAATETSDDAVEQVPKRRSSRSRSLTRKAREEPAPKPSTPRIRLKLKSAAVPAVPAAVPQQPLAASSGPADPIDLTSEPRATSDCVVVSVTAVEVDPARSPLTSPVPPIEAVPVPALPTQAAPVDTATVDQSEPAEKHIEIRWTVSVSAVRGTAFNSIVKNRAFVTPKQNISTTEHRVNPENAFIEYELEGPIDIAELVVKEQLIQAMEDNGIAGTAKPTVSRIQITASRRVGIRSFPFFSTVVPGGVGRPLENVRMDDLMRQLLRETGPFTIDICACFTMVSVTENNHFAQQFQRQLGSTPIPVTPTPRHPTSIGPLPHNPSVTPSAAIGIQAQPTPRSSARKTITNTMLSEVRSERANAVPAQAERRRIYDTLSMMWRCSEHKKCVNYRKGDEYLWCFHEAHQKEHIRIQPELLMTWTNEILAGHATTQAPPVSIYRRLLESSNRAQAKGIESSRPPPVSNRYSGRTSGRGDGNISQTVNLSLGSELATAIAGQISSYLPSLPSSHGLASTLPQISDSGRSLYGNLPSISTDAAGRPPSSQFTLPIRSSSPVQPPDDRRTPDELMRDFMMIFRMRSCRNAGEALQIETALRAEGIDVPNIRELPDSWFARNRVAMRWSGALKSLVKEFLRSEREYAEVTNSSYQRLDGSSTASANSGQNE